MKEWWPLGIEMYLSGATLSEIGARFGKAKGTIQQMLNVTKTPRRKPGAPLQHTLDDILQNFVAAPNGCWLWCGYSSTYPQVYYLGRKAEPHRLALEAKLGRAIRIGYMACHHCDQPLCIRGEHLFEGTPGDNTRDAFSKGRLCQGEQHPATKLSAEQVWAIRAETGLQKEIARRYGISVDSVQAIKYRRSWRALPEQETGK